jgi:hypothetical protein
VEGKWPQPLKDRDLCPEYLKLLVIQKGTQYYN